MNFRFVGLTLLLAVTACADLPPSEQTARRVTDQAAPMPGDAAKPSPAAPQTGRTGTPSYHSPEIGFPQRTSFGSSYYSPAD